MMNLKNNMKEQTVQQERTNSTIRMNKQYNKKEQTVDKNEQTI